VRTTATSEKQATAAAKMNGTFPAGNAGIKPPLRLYKSLKLKLQRGGLDELVLEPTFEGAALLRAEAATK
jgi:hypothetical protein